MALDTQEKRMMAMGVGRPWMRQSLAQGTIDEGMRVGIANAYGGNTLSPPAVSALTAADVLIQCIIANEINGRGCH